MHSVTLTALLNGKKVIKRYENMSIAAAVKLFKEYLKSVENEQAKNIPV
jgi:hypothetical protein